MDPSEKKFHNLSSIRKAMGNVFATRRLSRKLRSGGAMVKDPLTIDD